MKTFKDFLMESSKPKGTHEIVATNINKALDYLERIDKELYEKLKPDFNDNYLKAQSYAKKGSTKRKDMPRIRTKDVRTFQERLKNGFIDINKPFSKTTENKNPFPEGLSGEQAQEFLEAGLKIHDGNAKDDKVRVLERKIPINKLYPIQEQIYLSESLDILKNRGVEEAKKFLTKDTFFIVSSDNRIIDGHHRWLAAFLLNENLKVNTIMIDLPIKQLLPMSLAYGDAVGNKRNL